VEANVRCKSCGNSNPPGSKFCNQCASQLLSPFCSNCGNKNPSEAVFCNQCGSKLGILNMVKPLNENESTSTGTSKIDLPLSSSTSSGQNMIKLLTENFYEDAYGVMHNCRNKDRSKCNSLLSYHIHPTIQPANHYSRTSLSKVTWNSYYRFKNSTFDNGAQNEIREHKRMRPNLHTSSRPKYHPKSPSPPPSSPPPSSPPPSSPPPSSPPPSSPPFVPSSFSSSVSLSSPVSSS
jgi:ribosomal protein L40E